MLPGLFAGVMGILYSVAFPAIIFSGDLAPYLPVGIGLGLFSTIALVGCTALFSTLPGVIAPIQDVPVLLISLVISDLVDGIPVSEQLPTVLALLAITSLLVGVFSLLLGQLRLGNLIRFIPYPVIGGFLAGTGWFLSLGAILMLTHLPKLSGIDTLLTPTALLQWLPGLAFAILILWLQRRYEHPFILPAMMGGALALFFGILGLTQTPIATAQDLGLLLGPFSEATSWRPLQWQTLTQANWSLIAQQWDHVLVLLAVTLMALLLNISSLEVVVRQDMDLNQELRSAGVANVLSGLGGGLVGFHSLGDTALCKAKLAGDSRWVGIIAALLTGLVLMFGTSLLTALPQFILGGLVLYMGLDFLLDWLWLSRQKLPLVDYLMVVALMLTMATVGVLPSVGLGIAFSIAVFLLNYSRTRVVRHQLSGRTLTSHVYRVPLQQQTLQARGDQIQVLQLQGYLFFGSADQLLRQVRSIFLAQNVKLPLFIVLDFAQVSGIDSSAVYSFIKLKQTAPDSVQIVLTQLAAAHQTLLRRAGCLEDNPPVYRLEPNLEKGLQWCEEQLLAMISWKRERYVPLPLMLESLLGDESHIPIFMTYLEKITLPKNTALFQAGDASDNLYFLESGRVFTETDGPSQTLREWTYLPGTIIGATAFYLRQPHPTNALTESSCIIFILSHQRWQDLKHHHAKTAVAFQEMLLTQISGRLQRTSADLNILLF
jgi:SulP family sulfate permease